MGTHASNISYRNNETRDLEQLLDRDLKQLLDVFGSTVSLEEITSAYLKGGRNTDTVAELLISNLHGSTSGASSLSSMGSTSRSSSLSSKDEILEVSNGFMEKASISVTSTIVANQKKGSASMGTVVGVIGKEYAINKPSRNGSVEGTKPPKINIEEFAVYEAPTPAVETMRKDTEEFLFKMLGDGFRLDMKIIQDVLGACGYDVKKSIDKLLDISASTLKEGGDSFNLNAEEPLQIPIDTCKKSAGRLVAGPRSSKSNKDRCELEKEVLGCLFTVPQRIEEAPTRTGPYKAYKKPRPFGKIVSEPFEDTTAELNTPVVTLLGTQEGNEEDEEDAYQDLLKRAKEYLMTMRGYYEAAADAYTKEDYDRAQKLMEEGHFFKKKACEADEKSFQMFLGSKNEGMSLDVQECSAKEGVSLDVHECSPEEGMSLDVHEFSPKEAIRPLKHLLTSLSGSEAFPYLKIIIVGDSEGTKDTARKRHVQKFLEKESIKWTEERNGRTMVIRLEKIDRDRLSFAQK